MQLFVDLVFYCIMVIGLYLITKKKSMFARYLGPLFLIKKFKMFLLVSIVVHIIIHLFLKNDLLSITYGCFVLMILGHIIMQPKRIDGKSFFTRCIVIKKLNMFRFGTIVVYITIHLFVDNDLLCIFFGCIALMGLGHMTMKKMWTISEFNRKFRIDLNNITHPCDRLIATERRREYIAYKESIINEAEESYVAICMDTFENRARHILDKQYIHDYFGKPIANLENGSRLEITLNNEWQKKAAVYFFDHGLDYLGLPNIFELAILESNAESNEYIHISTLDYTVLIVRRID